MKKVLFVGDYYKGTVPEFGLDEWTVDIITSLRSTGLAEVYSFHFDKNFFETCDRGDLPLLKMIDEINPDYIVFKMYKPPSSMDMGNPLIDTFTKIKQKGIKTIAIWGNLASTEERWLARSMREFMDINVGTESLETNNLTFDGIIQLHYPKDNGLFKDNNVNRDLDVSFIGSIHGRQNRIDALNILNSNGIKLNIFGPDTKVLTREDYVSILNRTKISVSFSMAEGFNVINARPWEIMACGVLLFEQESKELEKFYTPGVDYVSWKDNEDLLEKVKYYLEHEDERLKIAEVGCRKTHELYSANQFWKQLII